MLVSIPTEGPNETALYIFLCQAGQYALAYDYRTYAFSADLETVEDVNNDGVPEIVFAETEFGAGVNSSTTYYLWEWDGRAFVDITAGDLVAYNGSGVITDTDGNGTKEVVLTQGIVGGLAAQNEGGPQRTRTEVWGWNGQTFVLMDSGYTSPEYRFQAMQDGDDASLAGRYDRALAFYQQAILDEKLQGWSSEWFAYYFQGIGGGGDATPFPTPAPDPTERPRIEAYSRYRILLLHIVRGYIPEAKTVYDTLQKKFLAGQVGYGYAEMATKFWNEYNASQNIGTACGRAIAYARAHTNEVLTPLGSQYGWTNRDYAPEDICPFK